MQVDTLKVPANSPILTEAKLKIEKLNKDDNGDFIMNTLQDRRDRSTFRKHKQ